MGTWTVWRGWVLTSGPPEPSASTDVAMPLVIGCGFGCTWWPAPARPPCEPWSSLSLPPELFDGVECSEWVLEGIWVSDMFPLSPLPSESLSRSIGNGASPPPWAPALPHCPPPQLCPHPCTVPAPHPLPLLAAITAAHTAFLATSVAFAAAFLSCSAALSILCCSVSVAQITLAAAASFLLCCLSSLASSLCHPLSAASALFIAASSSRASRAWESSAPYPCLRTPLVCSQDQPLLASCIFRWPCSWSSKYAVCAAFQSVDFAAWQCWLV